MVQGEITNLQTGAIEATLPIGAAMQYCDRLHNNALIFSWARFNDAIEVINDKNQTLYKIRIIA